MFTRTLHNEKRQIFQENAKLWGFLAETVNSVNIRKIRDPYMKENKDKTGFFSFVYSIPGIWLLAMIKFVAPKFKSFKIVNKWTSQIFSIQPWTLNRTRPTRDIWRDQIK